MPTPSDFQEPLAATGDMGLLREALQKRVAYALGNAEDPTDLVAVDADTGATILVLLYHGGVFFLDPADTTTAHDGVTCLVTSDGKRYLRENSIFVRAVLSQTETAPPVSPTIGDAYIVATAGTGAWATHDDEIAVFTARGWEFIPPSIGMLIFVEDLQTFIHYTTGGAWETGLSNTPAGNGTVWPSSILGGRTHWIVENQTTNDPPVSPTDGDAYIIGPSPTGDWSGHAAKLALANGDAWIITAPLEGYIAYDKDEDGAFVYSGSAWEAQTLVDVQFFDASGTWNKPAAGPLSPVLVEAMSGGGSGASRSATGNVGGGAGGSRYLVWLTLEQFADTEAVTIGGDAAGVTGNNDGNPGTAVSITVDGAAMSFAAGEAAQSESATNIDTGAAAAPSTGAIAPLGLGGAGGRVNGSTVRTAGGNGDGLGAPGGGPASSGAGSGSTDGGTSPLTGDTGGNGNNSGSGANGDGPGTGGGGSIGGTSGIGRKGWLRVTVFPG